VAPTVLEVVQQALDKMIIRAEALESQASPTTTVLSAPNDDRTQNGGIDALFADIDTPVLQQPAPQRPPMARFRHDERPLQRPSRSARRSRRLEEPRGTCAASSASCQTNMNPSTTFYATSSACSKGRCRTTS
jgi:hypothetical protein